MNPQLWLKTLVAAVLVLQGPFIGNSQAQDVANDATQSWAAVNCCDLGSLEAYLKQNAGSHFVETATLALDFQRQIASIRQGATKPVFHIPFEELGGMWKASKQMHPETDILGIGYGKSVPDGEDLDYFVFSPFRGVPLRVTQLNGAKITFVPSTTIGFVGGAAAYPTGHGSILAFAVTKDALPMGKDYSIRTPTPDPVYFGVVENVGLVYLPLRYFVWVTAGESVGNWKSSLPSSR